MNPKPETERLLIKAVIYDLDGLLVDSEPWWRAWSSLGTSEIFANRLRRITRLLGLTRNLQKL